MERSFIGAVDCPGLAAEPTERDLADGVLDLPRPGGVPLESSLFFCEVLEDMSHLLSHAPSSHQEPRTIVQGYKRVQRIYSLSSFLGSDFVA